MIELKGLRVLVVEDEPMLSLALQDMLTDLGCEIAGTAGRLEAALKTSRDLTFDIAVLDINLGGTRVDEVADAIAKRGIPFVFATGYGQEGLKAHPEAPVVEKPYESTDLERAFQQAMSSAHEQQ